MEFREMRRKRQQLSDAECVGILENATSGTLALQGDGGYPYAIRGCDKASFCVIEQDEVHGEEYTTYFRSVVAFGRIRILEDEAERMAAARLLGDRYHPHHEEALGRELAKSFSHMLVICLDIEHMTGKEAIELVRMKRQRA